MNKKDLEDNIVALLYGIDKGKGISETKKNSGLLFDFIQQEIDKAYKRGQREIFTEYEISILVWALEESETFLASAKKPMFKKLKELSNLTKEEK